MSFNIIGTGSAYPLCSMTNEDLSKILDTSDEWISSRTGIKSRHISTNETMVDFTLRAAKLALEDADINGEEIDLIICATIQGDYVTPSLACVIQKELGAK
ncbi:MAG: 3-oxoacyl-[acyl-carrier-protein] synthase, partial [Clostridia bacterium]|nr:3-oxoacyl-[acyl-carrier-protein] synthase [Clostridia bacterium]